MTEATDKQPNEPKRKDDGNQRFREFVDTTRTPKEEREDPRRGEGGRPDATTK